MADSAAPPKSLMGLLPSLQSPGFRLVDAGELYQFLNSLYGVHDINQPTATASVPLVGGINVVVAAPQGVTLPPPTLPGSIVTVTNPSTTAPVNVAGTGLADSPVAIAATGSAQFLCTAAGTWVLLGMIAEAAAP